MKIVIPGGSGQVGTILARHFQTKGDEVVILSRSMRDLPLSISIRRGACQLMRSMNISGTMKKRLLMRGGRSYSICSGILSSLGEMCSGMMEAMLC